MIVYNNQSGLTNVYLGSTNIAKVYVSTYQVYPTGIKFQTSYIGGASYSAYCDGNATLLKAQTMPSGYEYSAMTDVVIGDCITSVGRIIEAGYDSEAPFLMCESLSSVRIPDSVITIGTFAFNGCTSLSSITIPNSVTSIGSQAFYHCFSLSSITIPNSVTSIGDYAFESDALMFVEIGSGVTSIGEGAFQHCSSLQSITVEATTPPTLGNNALLSTNDCPIYVPCQSLEAYKTAWSAYESRIQCIEPTPTGGSDIQITYSAETSPTKLANICSQDVERVSIAGWVVFNHCITTINSALTSGNTAFFYKRTTVVENEEFADTDMIECGVSSEVTSIGNGAFSGNTTLSSFSIGAFSYLNPYEQNPISQLTSIGNYAFKNCSNMKRLELIGCKNIVPTLGTGVFDGCTSLEIIYVPNSMVNAFKTAPGWITYESIIQGA